MNSSEKKDLKLIEYQVEQIFVEIKDIKVKNEIAHEEVKKDLRFIKNNLFDPKEGLWVEVKSNSDYRKETSKWRNVFGVGIFSLIGKHLYDLFKN